MKNLKIKKIAIHVLLWVIVLAPLMWLLLSFIDVNMHNSLGDCVYKSWNLFEILF